MLPSCLEMKERIKSHSYPNIQHGPMMKKNISFGKYGSFTFWFDLFLFLFFSQDRVLLCISQWPQTCDSSASAGVTDVTLQTWLQKLFFFFLSFLHLLTCVYIVWVTLPLPACPQKHF
jgi:hypothetical protein